LKPYVGNWLVGTVQAKLPSVLSMEDATVGPISSVAGVWPWRRSIEILPAGADGSHVIVKVDPGVKTSLFVGEVIASKPLV